MIRARGSADPHPSGDRCDIGVRRPPPIPQRWPTIGKWLKSHGVRAEMRIATKTGMFGKPGDLEPRKVREELEKSLLRLQADYVDLYYAHRDDSGTDLLEVASGFHALVQEGLVREIGAKLRDLWDVDAFVVSTPVHLLTARKQPPIQGGL